MRGWLAAFALTLTTACYTPRLQAQQTYSLHLTTPTDQHKTEGDFNVAHKMVDGAKHKDKTTASFRIPVRCEITPAPPGEMKNYAYLTFWQKEDSGIWQKKRGPQAMKPLGGGKFLFNWDVTKDHTENGLPWQLRASSTGDCGTLIAPEQPRIHIKKGTQIYKLAELWLAYPYQLGGNGPESGTNGCGAECPSSPTVCDNQAVHTWGVVLDNTAVTCPNHCGECGVCGGGSPGACHHSACFDCSGYVSHVYKHLGITIPCGPANGQYNSLTHVATPRIGDVAWHDGHIMIYVGKANPGDPNDNQIKTREAPNTGQCTQTKIRDPQPGYAGKSGDGWCMEDETITW
ncbi:MAG: C40 family peptidase [Armatimonadetes bacterium]|nr:C40 family peptidase [Armatimonadota bacterium]